MTEVDSLQALPQIPAHRWVITHLGHGHPLSTQVLEFGGMVLYEVLDRDVRNIVGARDRVDQCSFPAERRPNQDDEGLRRLRLRGRGRRLSTQDTAQQER